MKFENIKVMNFENALRGMRNPKESWHLSDTKYAFFKENIVENTLNGISKTIIPEEYKILNKYNIENSDSNEKIIECIKIGPNDLELAKKLIRCGSVHRKFMRQIFVSVDITAPLYWWKEYATYKIATVENSTSTMQKLSSTPITIDCFEMDDYENTPENNEYWNFTIEKCEDLRIKYNETKDKKYWKELIRRLPDGWLQKRTCTFNYETILNICQPDCRLNHKLNEWSGKDNPNLNNFISFIKSLPYIKELIFENKEKIV